MGRRPRTIFPPRTAERRLWSPTSLDTGVGGTTTADCETYRRTTNLLRAGRAMFAGILMFGVTGRRRPVWGLMLALLMMIAVVSGPGCGTV